MPDNPERIIHPRERAAIMWTYLAAAIPLFGILVAALIYMGYQERSRTVVFHAKQAIAGQALMLLTFVVVLLFYLFGRLVGSISLTLGDYLIKFDTAVLWITFIGYAAWCFYYAWRTVDGHDLDYPLIGPRLRDRAE